MRIFACGLGLLLIGSVLWAPRPALPGRVGIALAIATLGLRPLVQLFWKRGPRVEWTAEGIWWLQDAGWGAEQAVLSNESAILGPFVFLIWSLGGQRRYAIVDPAALDSVSYRMLRSRLARPDKLRASCESDHATSVGIGRAPEL